MKLLLASLALALLAGCIRPEINVCNVEKACAISICDMGNTCIAKPLELKL